ncbi:MAG: gliding motility-associated C-terminal domain-containing protein [Bacteroidales bacterium]|nr:gliding motility-associated C-terminal domain-containing protein [Bacteroidales bacterium]
MKRALNIYVAILGLLVVPVVAEAQGEIQADQTVGCDSLLVKFTYVSATPPTSLYWDFDNGQTSNLIDPPAIWFKLNSFDPNPRRYNITVNVDVADFVVAPDFITLYRSVPATFTYADTLEAGLYYVTFHHTGTLSANTSNYTYLWDFDDGYTGNTRNVVHRFPNPGTYQVSLSVSDDLGCSNSRLQLVDIVGDDREIYVVASETEWCDTAAVRFRFVGLTDTISSVLWDFGNGTTSTLLQPDTVRYNQPGKYTVRFYTNGNTDNPVIKHDFINVRRSVSAIFDVEKQTGQYEYLFTHADELYDSTATYNFLWDFSDGVLQINRNTTRTFADTGVYVATFTVTDSYGCSDTWSRRIFVYDEILIQNVFSPNGDAINDYFIIEPVSSSIVLSIQIFNKAGMLVYSMKAPKIVWDGRTDAGIELNSGIYYYVLKAVSGDTQKLYNKSGLIQLYK